MYIASLQLELSAKHKPGKKFIKIKQTNTEKFNKAAVAVGAAV